MNRYNHSRIYKITDLNYTECYIGSTTNPLSKRYYGHKSHYKSFLKGEHNRTSSFYLFEKYGVENCKIELIENCNVNSKEELLKKEGEYIRGNECINKNIPCRTFKEYYLDNREQLIIKSKQYRSIKLLCNCGFTYSKDNVPRHHKTQRHKKYIDSLNQNVEQVVNV